MTALTTISTNLWTRFDWIEPTVRWHATTKQQRALSSLKRREKNKSEKKHFVTFSSTPKNEYTQFNNKKRAIVQFDWVTCSPITNKHSIVFPRSSKSELEKFVCCLRVRRSARREKKHSKKLLRLVDESEIGFESSTSVALWAARRHLAHIFSGSVIIAADETFICARVSSMATFNEFLGCFFVY